ncbi:MAG: hypothetical protein MN733_44290 [Nitrososphaera sp.]|nr:hypothetical protein [Nitrososphaera sp.]
MSNTVYTSGQLVKLTTVWDDKGVESEHTQLGLGSGVFADIGDFLVSGGKYNREAVRKAFGLGPFNWLTVVDCSMTLEQMIEAGHYVWSNPDITSDRFPIVGEGKVEYENKIFYFGRKKISSKRAKDRIITLDPVNPWRPWVTEQTLAFGATYPEEQRKGHIVGLGSVVEAYYASHEVLILYAFGSERRLGLASFNCGWRDCRFGASRRLVA